VGAKVTTRRDDAVGMTGVILTPLIGRLVQHLYQARLAARGVVAMNDTLVRRSVERAGSLADDSLRLIEVALCNQPPSLFDICPGSRTGDLIVCRFPPGTANSLDRRSQIGQLVLLLSYHTTPPSALARWESVAFTSRRIL
jgi:hypothetical protein